jgi:CRISPR system Cascade subunit CasE
MSLAINMLRLGIDPEALVRFVQPYGLNHANDEDLGYAVHAWLSACFGESAPKPFRVLHRQGAHMELLAYSPHDTAALIQLADQAPPAARAALCPGTLAHATMPQQWQAGARFSFELLACPVTRQRQAEKDVFLRRLEALPEGEAAPERGTVYREWLAVQFEGAAALESFDLEGFHLVRMLRRTQPTARARTRAIPAITRPRALCRGTLRVADPERFGALLGRGVGRHRAFGYGMLLLRPSAV